MNKSTNELNEAHFNRIALPSRIGCLNGEALVDPQELCRFEGKGGLEAPISAVVDISYASAVWPYMQTNITPNAEAKESHGCNDA